MYVLQSHVHWSSQQLHELDKKGLKFAKLAYPNHAFTVVSGRFAHRWVRDGGHHSTPLYLDQGRIRYARDAR
jgi:hypothetical protein